MTNSNNGDYRSIDGGQVSHQGYIGLLQEFAAKLVLEVFGAGGAIWGFSEVCGLRTKESESIRFWRSVAMTVAILFAVRWLRQLHKASMLLQHQKPQATDHGRTAVGPSEFALETPDNSFLGDLREMSPLGIQLSSVLFGVEKDKDEEEGLLSQEESVDEMTALTTSPRSPIF
eukprot:CAMPEP_0197275484 /NCGR_PEP_ID=MMETSP1432-20130617/13976_1 /TAXON_ID=44447 /ORGANISM="Pseudo-nitzschia delicatissima, Strain UNC1205" /LENGTH=172 /DNA_ID=CAMNT_0042741389 /DNA_START=42 /DNA_END=560 /DNA_ORIENTATION=+